MLHLQLPQVPVSDYFGEIVSQSQNADRRLLSRLQLNYMIAVFANAFISENPFIKGNPGAVVNPAPLQVLRQLPPSI
jgi:hypothetical protein